MLQVEQLPLTDPRWNGFVDSHPAALPFHHPSWATLLAACYAYRAFALVMRDMQGDIAGGLPVLEVRKPLGGRRYISLPFTDYCPPLTVQGSEPEVTRTLVDTTAALRLDALEVRDALAPAAGVHTTTQAVRHVLDLTGDVERGISKHHRRNIRKAEQSSLTVRFSTSPSDMEAFYRLHLLTRQRLGVPIQPWRFFESLAAVLQREKLGFVGVVSRGDSPVAAAVFMTWRNVMIYKYGASHPAFWELRPNNLLFSRAIHWGCDRGFRLFDWGRTDFDNQGLREFKSGWGASEELLRYSVIATRPPAVAAGRITRAITPVIQRSPAWVCRAMGEVLYRYAA